MFVISTFLVIITIFFNFSPCVQNIFFHHSDYRDLCFFLCSCNFFLSSCFGYSYVTVFHLVHPLCSVLFVMFICCLPYIFSSSFFSFLIFFSFLHVHCVFLCMTVFEPSSFTQLCQAKKKYKKEI